MCDCTFLRDHYSWINRFNFINKSFLASLANSNCFCKFSISIFYASIKYGFASGEIFVRCWDFIITIELLIPISLSDMPWILLEWSFSLNADETIWSHTLHLNKFFLCTRLICWLRFFFSPNFFYNHGMYTHGGEGPSFWFSNAILCLDHKIIWFS